MVWLSELFSKLFCRRLQNMSHIKQTRVMTVNAIMCLRIAVCFVISAPLFYGRQSFIFANSYTVFFNKVTHVAFRILTYVKQNAYRCLSSRGNTCCCRSW
uniref:Uncharacterized protein n=1 Tax=Bartonella rochalimae ATCC BAA-1498 TaxID=685782 RepID=E6YLS5_9HYPH|nr:hypothetical protein BARRO_50176 [Bartonella rochalimae ATCC BAA-1498]